MANEAYPKLGTLRYRITIQAPNKGVDEDGTVTKGWTTVGSVWASAKLAKPGKVNPIAERALAANTYEMDIRYLDVPDNARILWGDKVGYVIVSGDVWGDESFLRIWVDVRSGEKA